MPICTYVCNKRLIEKHTLGAECVPISYAQRDSLCSSYGCFRFTKQQTINAMSDYNTSKRENNKDLYKRRNIQDTKCASSQ